MIISVDFDNTIVNYGNVFLAAARERRLIDHAFKGDRIQLRNVVRKSVGGESAWMALQGYVYGSGIENATPSAGVLKFMRHMRQRGHGLVVISHKTEYGHFDTARVNLRDAAMRWLEKNMFLDATGAILEKKDIYFEPTIEEKVARIAALSPAVHVDDLRAIFDHPAFPAHVHRILFDTSGQVCSPRNITWCASWDKVEKDIERVAG